MTACECLLNCCFFNDQMKSFPQTTDFFKNKYCLNSNKDCARYIVFKELGNVPEELYPDEIEEAQVLLLNKENNSL